MSLFRCATLGLVLIFAASATANPVTTAFTNGPTCDTILPSPLSLSHELGVGGVFSPDTRITASSIAVASTSPCVADDGLANDFTVTITNTSGQAWVDVFFAADIGYTVGNVDGSVVNAFGSPMDAFKIDAAGINNSLSESLSTNGIFDLNESWTFVVANFTGGTPSFGSLSLSSSLSSSNANIVANPIPEPGSLALLGLGIGLLAVRRRVRPA